MYFEAPLKAGFKCKRQPISGRFSVKNEHKSVWAIRTATIIPDNERWLHEPAVKKSIGKSLAWAAKNPPKESNLSELNVAKNRP